MLNLSLRKNARLSCEDFKRILCSKYPKLHTDSDLLRRLFDVFDRDLDGSISFNEFVLGTATLLNGTIDEKLSLLFDINDLDGNGQMDISEVLNAIKNANESFKAQAQFAANVLHSIDLNQDGDISRTEFQNALKHDPILLDAFSRVMPKNMIDALMMLSMEDMGSRLTFKGLSEFWSQQKKDPKWHNVDDHRIDLGEFRSIMRKSFCCGEKTVKYLEKVFDRLKQRSSDDEKVEIRIVLNGLCHVVDASDEEKAGFYFDLYDYDNDGHIDPGELLKMILEAHEASTKDTKKLLELVALMDESNDGKLDKTEFLAAIKQNPEVLEMFGELFQVTNTTFDPTMQPHANLTEAGPNLKKVRAEYEKITKGIHIFKF